MANQIIDSVQGLVLDRFVLRFYNFAVFITHGWGLLRWVWFTNWCVGLILEQVGKLF